MIVISLVVVAIIMVATIVGAIIVAKLVAKRNQSQNLDEKKSIAEYIDPNTLEWKEQLNLLKRIERIILSHTTDISEIAKMANLSYDETLKILERISLNASKNKEWYFLEGSYIDYESKRIVLNISTDKLIVAKTNPMVNLVAWTAFGTGYMMLMWLVSGLLNFLPERVGVAFLVVSFPIGIVAMLNWFRSRKARIRKYTDLISEKNITAVDDIAKALHKSPKSVRKDLQNLIKDYTFINADFDSENDKIVVLSSQSNVAKQSETVVQESTESIETSKPLKFVLTDDYKNVSRMLKIIAILQTCAGAFFVLVSLGIMVFVAVEMLPDRRFDGVVVVIYFLLSFTLALGIVFSVVSRKPKRELKHYNEYINLILDKRITSAEKIAEMVNRPLDDVVFELRTMSNAPFFENIRFDVKTNKFVSIHN